MNSARSVAEPPAPHADMGPAGCNETDAGVGNRALTLRCGSLTFDDMKDAILTIRLPAATRRRIEALARAEDRSLSQQVERLIELGFAATTMTAESRAEYGPRSLAGVLHAEEAGTLEDWREIRRELSESLLKRMDRYDHLHR